MNENISQLCYDANVFVNTLRFQCSNRLFLIPFDVTHTFEQLQYKLISHDAERVQRFWANEMLCIQEEIHVLNELVRQSEGLNALITSQSHVSSALDALTITAMTFKLLQILDNFRQNKIKRIDAYYAEHDYAHKFYIDTQNIVFQQFVDEEFLLTTVLKNT